MKLKNQQYLFYLVGITILVTIGIQFYWNQQNYLSNQQQLFREVQDCLDRSVDAYYEDTSKNTFIALIDTTSTKKSEDGSTTLELLSIYNDLIINLDDSTNTAAQSFNDSLNIQIAAQAGVKLIKGKSTSTNGIDLDDFPNKIIVSINQDSIQFEVLKKYLDNELKSRKIATNYVLNHLKKDTLYEQFGVQKTSEKYLTAVSMSTLIPKNENLELLYLNPSKTLYQRGKIGILLSLIFSIGILLCMLYLLRIIRKQKELSEIKNDFMSNITHELKTPIATVRTALEGISSFNNENDIEKTNKYLKISTQQLNRLNSMVEKILDTANLDSDQLIISTENTDLIKMLDNLVIRFKTSYPEVHIAFQSNLDTYYHSVDTFHFENALNNLVDNACKYGNGKVKIQGFKNKKVFEIGISDNGPGIHKKYQNHIFEKFFRIPKGNQHDVKGFGIGLYYAQNIIAKHGGAVYLSPNETWTTFIITIPLSS